MTNLNRYPPLLSEANEVPPSLKLRRAKGDALIRRDLLFKNCKPTMIHSRKIGSPIDANNRIEALKAERDAILAMLRGDQPAFALAA